MGYRNDGALVSPTYHKRFVLALELGVGLGSRVGRFTKYPADCLVAFSSTSNLALSGTLIATWA